MEDDPLAFLDEPVSKASKGDDILSFLDKPQRRIPKAARLGAQAAIGAAQVAATPYELAVWPLASKGAQHAEYRKNIFEDIERLQEQKSAGLWDEQDQKLYDSLVQQIEQPELAEPFVKTKDIGVGSLIEKGAEKAGFDMKPEDLGEEIARLGGGFLDKKKVAAKIKDIPSLLTKEGRQAYKASKEAAKTASKWESLSRAAKGNPEKESLVDWAKKKNLSPEATTLLLQSKGRAEHLGKIAKKTPKYKGSVKELGDKLGQNYEDLKKIGRQGGVLTAKQTESLSNGLTKMISDMERTLIEGPDTKAAKTVLRNALFKLETEGANLEELINSRINIGQGINWKNVDPKGAMLNEGRELFMKAIQKRSPRVAEDLRFTDKSYNQYLKYAKTLDKKQAAIKIGNTELPFNNVVFGAALKFGLGASIPAVIKTVLAKEAIQRLSTQLITNPKLQGLHRQMIHASLSGSKNKQQALFQTMKRIVKEDDPELYSDLGLSP